ncbi:MAG: hypothetical protein ACRC26_10805, partial [Bacteroidales bacterium]
MKKILFILGAVSMLTFASCNSNSAKQPQATEAAKSSSIPVAQVLENPDDYTGGEIAVEGICT